MKKRTKIIATIGPASNNEKVLREMFKNGMNLARINFSHGDHDSNGKLIESIKNLRLELALPIGIIADLQGPRIRVVVGEEEVVEKGEYVLVSDLSHSQDCEFPVSNFQKISNVRIFKDKIKKIQLDKKKIIDCLEEGNDILIEDGRIKIKVVEKKDGFALTEVLVPGTIKNHKGVNIPDAKLDFGALTDKDIDDLKFALKNDVDFIALSFVGNARDVEEARVKVKEISGRDTDLPQIISKIERKEAIKNIDEIIEITDVVMVARGDLGIELPETKVVIYQKEIIGKCLAKNKPVIVATQMLDSMIENPIPTRAEVSDVSNAVIDHTDAVMLSGESANGKYPRETISTMAQIIMDTEESPYDDNQKKLFDHSNLNDYQAVIDSAHELAKSSGSKAIFMFSFSGVTPCLMSQHRPEQLMFVATNRKKTFYQTSILWGVRGFYLSEEENIDDFISILGNIAIREKRLQKGDKVVVIMGKLPSGKKMRLIGIQEVE